MFNLSRYYIVLILLFKILPENNVILHLNKFTIATANRAKSRITMAPRAMTIHLVTLTMVEQKTVYHYHPWYHYGR